MTYQQAQEKKWQVRTGEKSTGIFFFNPLEVENEDGDKEDSPATAAYANRCTVGQWVEITLRNCVRLRMNVGMPACRAGSVATFRRS
jgi:hypothetical protein